MYFRLLLFNDSRNVTNKRIVMENTINIIIIKRKDVLRYLNWLFDHARKKIQVTG